MLLALDTSTRYVGIALYDGVQVLNEAIWFSQDYHTVELAPAVARALTRAGKNAWDIKALGVALGPGSFTGLRIGLALAKGIAVVRQIPLIGVPTLDILAAGQPLYPEPMAAVLRIGRGRLAVGWYRVYDSAWQSQGQIEALTLEEFSSQIVEPTRICGELDAETRKQLGRKWKNVHLATPAQSVRRPAWLAELAWQRWVAGRVDDVATLAPFYLHYNSPIGEK